MLNWFLYGISAFHSASTTILLPFSRQVGLALRVITGKLVFAGGSS